MSTPAGWYSDPEMVNTRRYWDGTQWTDHRQEAAAAAPPSGAQLLQQQGEAPAPWHHALWVRIPLAIVLILLGAFIVTQLGGVLGRIG